MQFQIESKKRKPVELGLSPPRGATYLDVAWIKVGNTGLGFSRYSTENEWYLDTMFVNGLPEFHHGEGSRCCLKKAASGELKEALDESSFDKEA